MKTASDFLSLLKKMKTTLFFLLISSLIIFSTQARSIIPRSQPLSSLRQDECSYVVTIATSLSSPTTQDSISLRFGDADGNEVLASPLQGRFQPGETDVFILGGPCFNGDPCYLLFYRSGEDGWTPGNVTLIEQNGERFNFLFNVPTPNNHWFGYDDCPPHATPPPPPPANAAFLAVK